MNDTEILDKVIEALKLEVQVEGEVVAEDERSAMIKWIKEQRRHQSLAEYVKSTQWYSTQWYDANWEEQAIMSLRRIVREEIIKVLMQK